MNLLAGIVHNPSNTAIVTRKNSLTIERSIQVLFSLAETVLGLERASKTDFASVMIPNSMDSIWSSQFVRDSTLKSGFIHSSKRYLYEAVSTIACVSAPSVDTVRRLSA